MSKHDLCGDGQPGLDALVGSMGSLHKMLARLETETTAHAGRFTEIEDRLSDLYRRLEAEEARGRQRSCAPADPDACSSVTQLTDLKQRLNSVEGRCAELSKQVDVRPDWDATSSAPSAKDMFKLVKKLAESVISVEEQLATLKNATTECPRDLSSQLGNVQEDVYKHFLALQEQTDSLKGLIEREGQRATTLAAQYQKQLDEVWHGLSLERHQRRENLDMLQKTIESGPYSVRNGAQKDFLMKQASSYAGSTDICSSDLSVSGAEDSEEKLSEKSRDSCDTTLLVEPTSFATSAVSSPELHAPEIYRSLCRTPSRSPSPSMTLASCGKTDRQPVQTASAIVTTLQSQLRLGTPVPPPPGGQRGNGQLRASSQPRTTSRTTAALSVRDDRGGSCVASFAHVDSVADRIAQSFRECEQECRSKLEESMSGRDVRQMRQEQLASKMENSLLSLLEKLDSTPSQRQAAHGYDTQHASYTADALSNSVYASSAADPTGAKYRLNSAPPLVWRAHLQQDKVDAGRAQE